jgi:glycosyltransferase involved in cell wall biosynthesis
VSGRRWNTVHVTTIDLTAWCFLRSWFQRLLGDGHRVTLVTTAGPFRKALEAEGVAVVDVPMARSISPLSDARSVMALHRTFRQLRPDVVHTHTSKAGFLGRLAARLAGVPTVFHTMHEPPHNAASGAALRLAYIWLERLAARWADHIITVSYANEREIQRTRLVEMAKLTVIREGLDLSRYPRATDARAAVRSLGLPDDALVVGTVGRLETAKGHRYLIEAVPQVLAQVPRARFVFVGSGVLHDALRQQVRVAGLSEHILFTGFRDDMLELMQGFDLFVLPSLWEGLGIVLLEAMAYSRAVVASAVGGVQDVVVPPETGLLVPPRQPAALAAAMVRLLQNHELRAAMGAAGYQRLTQEFRDDLANERMMALYRKYVRRGARDVVPG